MNALLLTVILGTCLILGVFVKRLSIVHPAILFISMFFINSLSLLLWVPTIPDLRINTVLIVSVSCIAFYLVSSIGINKKRKKNTKVTKYISYSKTLAVLFVFADVIVIFLYVRALRNVVGRLVGGSGSFAQIMGLYSGLIKFSTEDASLPTIVKLSTEVVYASGFVFGFIQINNFIVGGKKEINLVLIVDIGLSLLLSLLSGSRSGAIRMVVGFVAMLILLQGRISKKRSIKTIRRIAIISLLVIISFKAIGNLLGRNNERSLMATLFMYIGGPIKNLDMFLNENYQRADLIGKMTFANQYRNIANLTGNSKYLYQISVLPYVIINKIDLGNVYTALTSLVYDFGEYMAVLMISVMGLISRWIFNKAAHQVGSKKVLWILTYSFLAYFILMSGFAEKFFGIVLSVNLYRHLVFFFILYKALTVKTNLSKMTHAKVIKIQNALPY